MIPKTCDRCGTSYPQGHDVPEHLRVTFFNVTESSGWAEYGRPGEEGVCKPCMEPDLARRYGWDH